MIPKYRVILDTNILVSTISSKSSTRWLFDEILDGVISLILSNEIVFEYLEVLARKSNSQIAKNIINALLYLPNTELTSIYYYWNLIENDPDDNKFVDAYLISNPDFLISNDKHFNILKSLNFPKVNIISFQEFEQIFRKNKY